MTKTHPILTRWSPTQFLLTYPAKVAGGICLDCVCTWYDAVPNVPMLDEAGWVVNEHKYRYNSRRKIQRKEHDMVLPTETDALIFCNDIYARMK